MWIHGQLTAIHVHIKSDRADGTGDIFFWTRIIHTLSIKRGVHQATQVLHTLYIFSGVHQAKASSSHIVY